MPRRLATAIADDRTGSTGELDAAGLQALARASLTGDPSAEEAAGHKRGPFRPGVWLNARERARARLSVHYFHAIDGLVVVIVTLLSLFLLTPQGLAQARVGNVLPVILGAVVTLGLMRSIDIYRFGRDTSGIIHLGTVGALVMTGALVAVATGLVLGGTNAALWLVWPALLLVSLYGLHLCWLELIRRMRTTGALTPNVVLVGATKHAEAMIREAMQRRDLNIIGVFDDRMARSPKAVEGVPVLGDSEALMSHRILPYVDRVVLAIDPRAEERVRDLTRRLGALPNPVSLLVDTADGKLRAAAMDRLGRPRSDVHAFTMPGYATGDTSKSLAVRLGEALGVTFEEIDIRPACEQMLRDLDHPFADGEPVYDVTFENVQAGLRYDYLFRLANHRGGIVVGTGDLSELALGWCTYGVGDQMSHYNVNAGVPKTLVQHLIRWVADSEEVDERTGDLLREVLDQEISPELVPSEDDRPQATEDFVGPYALQDFTLHKVLRMGYRPRKIAFMAWHAWRDAGAGEWPAGLPEDKRVAYTLPEVRRWLEVFVRRFFASQFKRSALPNGPKVSAGGTMSPRGDWRMPSDASAAAWLRELEEHVPGE